MSSTPSTAILANPATSNGSQRPFETIFQPSFVTEHQLLAGEALIRLPQVLAIIPVSRSAWYAGIVALRYPPGIKISRRTTAWRVRDIAALLVKLNSEKGEPL